MIEVFGQSYDIFNHPNAIPHFGNVKNYRDFIPVSHRDCLIWQDGPNKMEMEEAKKLLSELQESFNTIVIATPNGFKNEGAYQGNEFEINRSHWELKDYEELGFKAIPYLKNNTGIIGFWKREHKIVHEVIADFKVPEKKIPSIPPPAPVIPKYFPNHKRLHLPDVTCVCADTTYYHTTMHAFWWSYCQVQFGRMILFTDTRFYEKGIDQNKVNDIGLEIIDIPIIQHKIGPGSYSEFMIKKLAPHITTKYILVIQGDGWVIDADQWKDEFMECDYIGSPWHFYHDGYNVGNGGFSWRSKRLHMLMTGDQTVNGVGHAEDTTICRIYRKYFENIYDLKYAPLNLARKFAYDTLPQPCPTFGFHQVDTKGYELLCRDKYGYF